MLLSVLQMLWSVYMTSTIGRPTDYTPELCQKIVNYFRKGWSIEEICLDLHICVQSYYNWKKIYPAFLEAIQTGEFYSKGWWQKRGRKALFDKTFNDKVWSRNMNNRFGWDKEEVKKESTNDEIDKDRELLHKCKTE